MAATPAKAAHAVRLPDWEGVWGPDEGPLFDPAAVARADGQRRGMQGRDAGDERQPVLERERLDQVVVGAEREPADLVLEPRGGGQHQDPHVRVLAGDDRGDLVAVSAREVAVEHDDVVVDDAGLQQRARAVVGDVDGHALAAQPAGDGPRQPPFVLCDQDAHLYAA